MTWCDDTCYIEQFQFCENDLREGSKENLAFNESFNLKILLFDLVSKTIKNNDNGVFILYYLTLVGGNTDFETVVFTIFLFLTIDEKYIKVYL